MTERASGTWRQRLMFGVMYRLGLTPWDGHELPKRLRTAAERAKGRALDIGCGTGDMSIYLQQRGWTVTAVDFVAAALARARKKARAAGAMKDGSLRFVQADATKLRAAGVQGPFDLIVDMGLLHGLGAEARRVYVRELDAVAAPGATMVIGAFRKGARRGPEGIDKAEIEDLFGAGWTVAGGEPEIGVSSTPGDPICIYELRRK